MDHPWAPFSVWMCKRHIPGMLEYLSNTSSHSPFKCFLGQKVFTAGQPLGATANLGRLPPLETGIMVLSHVNFVLLLFFFRSNGLRFSPLLFLSFSLITNTFIEWVVYWLLDWFVCISEWCNYSSLFSVDFQGQVLTACGPSCNACNMHWDQRLLRQY